MANIYRQSQLFREALIRRERRAATQLAGAYTRIWASIQRELDLLLPRLAQEQSAGLILREQQLRLLLAQVERQVTKFTAIAVNKIVAEQKSEIEHGADDALNLLRRAYSGAPPGLGISFAKLPEGVIEAIVGNLGDGSPLRHLLDTLGPEVSRDINALLINSIAQGRSIRRIAREMQRISQQPLARTLLISRTEVLRAYRQGSIATYQANRDVVKGWTWLSAKSERTCIACWMMDGTVHPAEEEFASHPNCLTAGAVIVGPKPTACTSRRFDGEVIEIQTLGGHSLTVTPNHPILTSAGWVAAQFLHEGGDVISSLDSERIAAAFVRPDNQNAPSLVEQIWKTLSGSGQVRSRSMPTSPEDFHGDGMNGEVDVVWTDSLLRGGFESSFLQPFEQEQFFGGSAEAQTFPGQSGGQPDFWTFALASDGSMRGGSISPMLFGASCGHHQPIGLSLSAGPDVLTEKVAADHSPRGMKMFCEGQFRFPGQITAYDLFDWYDSNRRVVPERNSRLNQDPVDYLEGDSETTGQLLTRLTGLVSSDKISKIRRRPFSGQVYNLQTESGWYSANNIITHNCRCTPVPLTKSWSELGFQGMPEQPPIQTGENAFLMLPAEQQRRIMGDASYRAWKAGAVNLQDFVGTKSDARWGTTNYHRSLTEILGPAAQQYMAPTAPQRRAA